MPCDGAFVGAGPYGLAAGARLRQLKGLSVSIFGEPARFCRIAKINANYTIPARIYLATKRRFIHSTSSSNLGPRLRLPRRIPALALAHGNSTASLLHPAALVLHLATV